MFESLKLVQGYLIYLLLKREKVFQFFFNVSKKIFTKKIKSTSKMHWKPLFEFIFIFHQGSHQK